MYKIKNKNKGVRISLIVAFFAVLLGCLVLFASNPFSVAEKANADAQTPSYDEVSAVSDDEISAQSAESLAAAWNTAVQESLDGNGKQVTFILTEDWTAANDSEYTTSFGAGVGFDNGRICIPTDANIVLDLNGHTIDRNLTDKRDNGSVIYILGTLELTDSSVGGKITGAFNDKNGGGILVNGISFTMNGGEISGNNAGSGGGVGVIGNSVFTMNSGKIEENIVNGSWWDGYGGGVYVDSYGTFTMNGGEISHNKGGNEGGGVSSYGTFTLNSGIITENTCNEGGGIDSFSGTFTMTGGIVSENTAYVGGGIAVWDIAVISGGTISGNTAIQRGGGVYSTCTSFIMSGGNITGNKSDLEAAGISVNGTFEMTGGTISDNECPENGAGVYVWNGATFTMFNGTISDNISTGYDGAGVNVGVGATFIMLDGTISGNSAGSQNGSGGGVAVFGKFSMSGGTITNNTATFDGNGGGVHLNTGTFEMTGGKISNNEATCGGGVNINYNSHFIMNNGYILGNKTSFITNNGTQGNGGGVYVDDSSSFVLNGGILDGNNAANSGGGIFVKNSNLDIRGGEITYNIASCGYQNEDAANIVGGGGIFFDGGTLNISGGDISYNVASNGSGGGIHMNTFYTSMATSFSMSGGTITDNMADAVASSDDGWAGLGGGIYFVEVEDPMFSGGEIKNNRAKFAYGGVALYYGMLVTGDIKIYDNYVGLTSRQQSNVNFPYPDNSNIIDIQGYELAASGKAPYIGIANSGGASNGMLVKNLHNIYWDIEPVYNKYFFNDDGAQFYFSLDNNGSLYRSNVSGSTPLPIPTVTLNWQYRVSAGSWTNMASGQSVLYVGKTYEIRAMNGSTAVTITNCVGKDLSGMSLSEIRNAGDYTLTVDGISYKNPVATFKIVPVTLSITWSDSRLTYTGMQQYPVPTLNGVVSGDSVSPVCDTSNAGVNAGKYSVHVSGIVGLDVNNYKLTTDGTNISYEIYRAQLNKPTASGSFNYNGEEQTYSVGGFNSTLMSLGGTYAATNAGNYTATVSIKDTKNYEWVDGTVTPVNVGWTINKISIFVGGISVANKEYDGTKTATVDISTAELLGIIEADRDKLGLVFTAGSEFDSAAVGLRAVKVTGIALTGEAAGNYVLEFDEVTRYGQIYPATITISGVVANGKYYDGTTSVTFDASNATITGAVADEISDLITNLIVSGYFDSKNAGTGVGVTVTGYRLGGEFAGNYIVDFENSEQSLTADVAKAQVEVTLGATEYTITYGNGLKITFTQNSPVKSESVNLALEYYDEHGNTKLTGVPTDAGKYLVKVVVDPADPNLDNYTVKTTGEGLISEATVTIEKASLTVTVENLEIEYGAAKPADSDYTLIYNGWLNGDAAKFEDGTITFVTGITISTDYAQYDGVDSYEIALSDGELKNYEITYVNGKLNVVAKKVTVTISDKTSAYGEEEAELTSDAADVAVNGDDLQITLTRDDETNLNAGKYAITGVSANSNYNVTFINGVYEITKAKLTVTANDNTITYGDKASDDGATYGAFAYEEDESVLDGTLGFRYTYTQYGDVYEQDGTTEIAYYIIPYGLTSDNYEIEFVNGVLTVEKKEATVTVSNAASDITNVPGDRADAAEKIKYSVTGTVNGDDLQILLTISETGVNGVYSVTWCAVGVYDVTATYGNTNYDVTFVFEDGATKGTYTVSQGTLIITANTLILSYGDSLAFGSDIDMAVTAEGLPVGSTLKDLIASGVISGTLTVVGYGDAAYDKYAAMGSAYRVGDDIFDASGNRISYIVLPTGLSSSSYNIEFKPGRLMIEPKSIMVTLDGKTSVYGEADKDLTASVADGTLVNYDPADGISVADFLGITGLMRAAGTDAGNYAITATGADNKNYRVTFVNGVYTITQYEVEVKWISGNADDTDFGYTYNAAEQSPVATFEMPDGTVYKSTDLTDRFIEVTGSGLNAGDYKAQAFLLNSNLKFKTGTDTTFNFTIAKKQLGVKWYASADDIGDSSKVLNPADTVEYSYRVGYPYAPVVELSGIEAADNVSGFYYISGEQSAVSITPYEAELHILNSNYSIAQGDAKIYFTIVKSAPGGFAWYDKHDGTQVSGDVKYEYNGEVQHPVAAALQNEDFIYTIYVVKDGSETKITSTINVGSYKIVAKPVDNNLELTDEEATLYFEIVAMEVTVVWSDTSFEYNGKVQVPTAYYTDAQGQKVSLTVNGDNGVNANEDGSVYSISVTLDTPNYKFVVDGADTDTLEATYTITAKEITVSWTSKYTDEDGNAKWEIVYDNSDESESVTAFVTMQNEAEKVGLTMKVWYQANENDAPVQVNSIKNAGIYTLCVELADKSPNYRITDSEQTFRIAKRSLTFTAADKEVNTGDKAPVLTATFGGEGFADGEDAESLGLVGANGGMGWLATNYNLNSPYIAESEYTKPEDIEKLETLADLNGYKGYFIVLTDSEARLKELNAILSNYDWSFTYGRMIIIAVEGDVSIVLTQSYNGEDQLPAAKYKVGDAWLDLKVEVYTNSSYTKKIENPEVKDVGDYYILLKKYTDDNVTLEGADENGNVKKVFTITKREIKVNVSDKSVAYGEVTETNYTDYLATLWAYASNDALYRPLDGDELEISLNVNFDYDAAGYAVVLTVGDNVAGYEIEGSWSKDTTLRNNYRVVFEGSNGDKGLFTITNAKITYTETLTDGFNQILETDKANGNYLLGLYNRVNGKYEHISIAGNPDASVHIFYSNVYDRAVYELTDNLPQDETSWKELPLCNIPVTADGSYYYNFKIVVDNHETYYGQWTVEVIAGKAYIRFIFSNDKRFETTYGDEMLTGTELAAKLYEDGYVNCIDLTEEIFRENILNGNLTAKVLVDGALNKGAYAIVFEGIEKLNPDWIITYKQDVNASDDTATNLNMYVVNQRKITLDWDETSFVYDGTAHLPTPSIEGWTVTGSTVNGNETVYSFVNDSNGMTLSLKVTTNGGDFTTVGSENIVIAEIEDDNYALDSFNATRAVSIVSGLDPTNPSEPTVTVGGVPAWVIGLLAGIAAVLLIALIIAILKKRKVVAGSDDDGFYDDATAND